MRNILPRLILVALSLLAFQQSFATGEPSTYFQVYVPPNNDPVMRNVCLIVTAIYDSTAFTILDDGADGDTDDTKTGMLMAGQSYILYIKDNGINDDARYASGGVWKQDGDYFIVTANKLVFTSQSTNSDWQHDWVPSTDKKSIGQKFIVYAPQVSSSPRDINVFAYEDSTVLTFQKISPTPTTQSGYTNINLTTATTVFTRTLNRGQDIIYKYGDGRDAMASGHSYMLLSNKPVTVQYGALYGNERDGGGYVPSSNGSSSGELFHFAVPYQAAGEQEIRIVSWDANNAVTLERFNNSNNTWVAMKSWTVNANNAVDWVGKNNTTVQTWGTTFRVKCSPGKRVSIFEGNWFETGSPGTSDMATMVSSANGTTAGTEFLTYMAPPGNQQNVRNPFTGLLFGTQLTHLYIFAKDTANVTVKDAYTNGTKISRTYNIGGGKYIDCYLTLAEWNSIYNGGQNNVGPERPYLSVHSNAPVSVMNSNFNDNWMFYTGSSLTQAFTMNSTSNHNTAKPNDTVIIKSELYTGSTITNPNVKVTASDGIMIVGSVIVDSTTNTVVATGTKTVTPTKTDVNFTCPNTLNPNTHYSVQTMMLASCCSNNGKPLVGQVNATLETIVTGTVASNLQQAVATETFTINENQTDGLLFSVFSDNILTKDSLDSWTTSWVDINNDGWDDVFMTDKRKTKSNRIYLNNQLGGFTRGMGLGAHNAINVANSWADYDNDGDEDGLISTNTQGFNTFYKNLGGGTLQRIQNMAINTTVAYYHGAAFADYDNDGKVDLFLSNFFPTKYNELYHNDGSNNWTKVLNDPISTDANQSIGQTWADYDGDGFQDLFVPNGAGYKNSLFHNKGNGHFEKVNNAITQDGGQSVGSVWGDYDNDGDLDLFVTNSNSSGNFLYRNDGGNNFTKITGSPVNLGGKSHGCSFADIDNDGDLDLYVTNDAGVKFLFRNEGSSNWTRLENALISCDYGLSFGHQWSDYDHDGDLDLIVSQHAPIAPNRMFTNNGNTNKWMQIKLIGVVSNASAIGARVKVKANGKWQIREVNSQSGFGGQGSLWQHFGLKDATTVDSIIVRWPSGNIQVLTNQAINQRLTITETLGNSYKVAVYLDNNNNCTRDANEPLLDRATVTVAPFGTKYFTKSNGLVNAYLPNGTYALQVANENGLSYTCSSPVSVTVSGAQASTDTVMIPATATCNNADLSVIMGGTAIRTTNPNNNFTIVVTNNGRATSTGAIVSIELPLNMNYSAFSPAASSNTTTGTSRTISWNVTTLAPFESQIITFKQAVGTGVNIGDIVSMTSTLSQLTAGDCNLNDNSVTQQYKVVGSMDPNDILVAPTGYGPEGFIKPDQTLTYTIRFQNVGNMPASRVVVNDVLPDGLDMSTFHLVASSHQGMNVRMNGNKVVFNWESIYLPDSTSDAEGSEGYIIFSINPRNGIAAGTKLENKASILFDENGALITNKVLNTIQSSDQEQEMIQVIVYPNPVHDVMQVSLKHRLGDFTNKTVQQVNLYNITGSKVLTRNFTPEEERNVLLPVDIRGVYIVEVIDNDGAKYNSKAMIRIGE